LLGISLVGTSAIITIPFISTSCAPKDEDDYTIFESGSTRQEITTKIEAYFRGG
jgi:hypothetical protein